ncbi:LytTR family DNA-binding domain-containing protein [uncultured Aquimarina sp.]|uniref:LytR/AlgR family response regulator transcription factor n=1 Tax=uncultured Aquimarina sp. TaxID=575652 RepID=UPI0026298384|nr:LytTR family DNA-binding domain-containing protein [uncultured Aquimarina sp.]
MISNIIKKPHPFVFNIYSIVIPSVLSFLIIVVLAPFNFQELEISLRASFALIVSIIVALSIYASIKFLKRVFPKLMSEDNWTFGKEFLLVLFILVIITILILIAVLAIQTNTTPLIPIILKTASITMAISVFPIGFLILFEQYKYQKNQLEKANKLTDSLKNSNNEFLKGSIGEQHILIKSESNDIELRLNYNDLVYMKSDGNYVEVYFINANELQKKLIRNRIKNIEAILPEKHFLRCHNRFIINSNAIIKVEGNARNLLLHLKNGIETIPVSRAKANLISDFIYNLNG